MLSNEQNNFETFWLIIIFSRSPDSEYADRARMILIKALISSFAVLLPNACYQVEICNSSDSKLLFKIVFLIYR